MKTLRTNISQCPFILLKLETFGKIVTPDVFRNRFAINGCTMSGPGFSAFYGLRPTSIVSQHH